VGNRVFVFHRVNAQEVLECLDAASGERRWKAEFPATYRGGVNPDNGPRCVPLVHKNSVYVFGAAGDLSCVNAEQGNVIWTQALYDEYSGSEGYFGAGSTPLVVNDKIIVNVGGRKAGVVAFHCRDGKVAWQATDEDASYSAPTLANWGGKAHAVLVTRLNALAVDADSGKVRFSFPFGSRGPTVNAATPLVFDDCLFVSAAYGVGARLSRIYPDRIETIWANDDSMSSQYTTCVYHQGHLYGIHGREDFGNGELRCLEAASGKVVWRVNGFGVGHLILIKDQLLVLTTDGMLQLANASPQAFRPLAKTRVSSNVTRALPALANGRLYLRDNAGQAGKLICLELSAERP
jgi:outer membrane protein assembly factor BamB